MIKLFLFVVVPVLAFEVLHQVGRAAVDKGGRRLDGDRFVCVVADVHHAAVDIGADPFGNVRLGAALAKIDVRILIPRRPDSAMLKLASGSYIADCLRAGIKVYFYEAGMLHAKSIVIDDEFSTTGSTNFDFRSMEYNFECNAFIYSKEINSRMKEIFFDDIRQSTCVTISSWRKRPFVQKLKESCVRLMSPVL